MEEASTMHHLGYVFQQMWNEDEQYRKHLKRQDRRDGRRTRTAQPRRKPVSF
jgi:hypothetical protein